MLCIVKCSILSGSGVVPDSTVKFRIVFDSMYLKCCIINWYNKIVLFDSIIKCYIIIGIIKCCIVIIWYSEIVLMVC